MTHDLRDRAPRAVGKPSPAPRNVLLALLWSAAMALTALAWAIDLLPHPFADADQAAIGAVFNTSDPLVGTAFTLALSLLGIVCATTMRWTWHGRQASTPSAPLLGAWAIVVAITLVLLHGALLAFLGYTPVVLILGWFEPGLFGAYLEALTSAQTIFLLSGTLGAVLWGNAAIRYRRVERAACNTCGRRHGWTEADEVSTRKRALRTGRIAVRIAVTGLLVYPALRIPWLFGIRVGVDAETWAQLQTEGIETGIALGMAGLVGSLLILGLVRDWGVRFPSWMLGSAGRTVPVRLAVLPAVVVAIGFVAIGRGTAMSALTGAFAVPGAEAALHIVAFGALLPAGIALAAAAAAYAVRRRAVCGTCRQGEPEQLPSDLRRPDRTAPVDRRADRAGAVGDGDGATPCTR